MAIRLAILILLAGLFLIACSPKIGSESWCEHMDDKPKGDWSSNEAAEYAKSCVFRSKE